MLAGFTLHSLSFANQFANAREQEHDNIVVPTYEAALTHYRQTKSKYTQHACIVHVAQDLKSCYIQSSRHACQLQL